MDRKKRWPIGRELTGFILLTVLLLGGLLSSFWLGKHHRSMAQTVDTAGWYALGQNWDKAAEVSSQASRQWQQKWNLCAVFADHTPMEEIDTQFAQLNIYASARDAQEFAAVCSALSQNLRSMADAHALRWWNVL